jgi:arsenate reductase
VQPAKPLKAVFVCFGNICRSPMAAAFARAYGSDVLLAESAGLRPASNCSSLTRQVMAEKNIDIGDHVPRGLEDVDWSSVDLLINMSGLPLPFRFPGYSENWKVRDPIGESEEVYRAVRDEIEMQVMHLILRLRTGKLQLPLPADLSAESAS